MKAVPGEGIITQGDEPPADLRASALSKLPNRQQLATEALSFVVKAFAAFTAACNDVRLVLERKLRNKSTGAGLFSLLFDVVTGLLLPGLAGKLTNTVLATLIPPKASTAAHAIGLRLLESNTIGTLVTFAVGKAKTVSGSAWKELVNESGGPASGDAFFQWLQDKADVTTGALLTTIWELPDDELVAVYLAYHPSLNSAADMRERISGLLAQYQEQVEPIGQRTESGGNMAYADLHQAKVFVVVVESGPPRLALLERTHMIMAATGKEVDKMPGVEGMYPDVPVRSHYEFKAWIDREMADPAVQRTKELGGVQVVLASDVEGLP